MEAKSEDSQPVVTPETPRDPGEELKTSRFSKTLRIIGAGAVLGCFVFIGWLFFGSKDEAGRSVEKLKEPTKQQTVASAPEANVITEEGIVVSFGTEEVAAMLKGPTTDYLCVDPLPDSGGYLLRYGVDSELWQADTKAHASVVTFQSSKGHKRVRAWLGKTEADCGES